MFTSCDSCQNRGIRQEERVRRDGLSIRCTWKTHTILSCLSVYHQPLHLVKYIPACVTLVTNICTIVKKKEKREIFSHKWCVCHPSTMWGIMLHFLAPLACENSPTGLTDWQRRGQESQELKGSPSVNRHSLGYYLFSWGGLKDDASVLYGLTSYRFCRVYFRCHLLLEMWM